MKFGLTKKQLLIIKEKIAMFQEIKKALVFGSRIRKDYKEASDLDIVIFGKKSTPLTAAKLKLEIEEESIFPFFVDILNYNSLHNNDLIQEINNNGTLLFERKLELQ